LQQQQQPNKKKLYQTMQEVSMTTFGHLLQPLLPKNITESNFFFFFLEKVENSLEENP
jgi:hypothetical protein